MARSSTSWNKNNRPAPKGPGRPKGSKDLRTQLKEQIGKSSFWMIEAYLENEGAEQFIREMRKLKGHRYTTQYNNSLEYFKGKLRRLETTPQDNKGQTTINNYLLSLPEEVQKQLAEALLTALPVSLPEPVAQGDHPPKEDLP